MLQALGDLEGAKGLLEQTLASDLENLGEDHPEVAIRRSNLALVLQALGSPPLPCNPKTLLSELKSRLRCKGSLRAHKEAERIFLGDYARDPG